MMKMMMLAALALTVTTFAFTARASAATPQDAEKKVPQKIVQTAGHKALGDFAPEFAHYNDDILFGEVWSRNDKLSLHDRSIVTVSTLIGAGVLDSSLKYHIASAKKNGVTKDEMVEMLTQIAFYAGWPKAWAAFRMAKEVYADEAK
ncbi:MAG: carboxymuconolactone decarboxylase family protein [Selenomonadaceae bacterium]|nr:carboxymuconolactone decarboxylase family protein [Selenomonadaceae bacterium]